MTTRTLLLAAALGLSALSAPPALAQNMHAGHDMSHANAATAAPAEPSAMSEGSVRKVDKTAGKITIAHGPLQNLGMPGMTMAFRVTDAGMLDKVKPGDKIRFVAERVDGIITVTTLETAH